MTGKFLMKSIRRAAIAAGGLLPYCSFVLAQPIPNNFMQVGAGVARAGGVLHFDYSWGSSTGNLADLAVCRVGERVTYPGNADPFPFPNPPWNQNVNNPTILWVPAIRGVAQDNHSPGRFAPPPYAAAQVNADQIYRYECRENALPNRGI